MAGNQTVDSSAGLAAFDGKRYLSLETYRKSGNGVRTPVWFAAEPTNAPASDARELYVYTATDSGKAKRIRHKGVVKIAPCDARGNVSGEWSMPTPRLSAAKSSPMVALMPQERAIMPQCSTNWLTSSSARGPSAGSGPAGRDEFSGV